MNNIKTEKIDKIRNIVIVILFLIFLFLYLYENFIKPEFDFGSKGKASIGLIVASDQNSTTRPWIAHWVNGKPYKSSFVAQLPGLVNGERFCILYNPKDPEDILVQLWRPLFLPNEKTSKSHAKITYISEVGWGIKRPGVTFEYKIGNEKIERCQELPMDFKTKYPTLKIDNIYEIEYWLVDPRRAIIYLDKPVN